MSGDVELDGTKLPPDEAAERWSLAGETLRTAKPDAYRKVFALAEQLAAGNEAAEPDEQTRAALVAGSTTASSDERTAIHAAVMSALDAIAADPRLGARFAGIDALLRAVDWSAVDVDLVRAMLHTVCTVAPMDAIVRANPLADESMPIAGMGIADVARVVVAMSANDAEQAPGAPKGGN